MNTCEKLLNIKSSGNYLVRNVDEIIHSFDGTTYEDFVLKQAEILSVVQGCEKEVFNDPRVFYVGKPFLSGKTGTMSTILTNGYLVLYNSLFDSVQVNADVDLQILLNLVIRSKENMPLEERQVLKDIVKKLLVKTRTNILSKEWFQEYKQAVKELMRYSRLDYQGTSVVSMIQLLRRQEDFDFSPSNYSMGPKKKAYYVNLEAELRLRGTSVNEMFHEAKEKMKVWIRKGFFPDADDSYSLWELHPPYVTALKFDDGGTMYNDSFELFLGKDIPFLETLFTF